MTTEAQLGDSLKNTLTEEVNDRFRSLVMEPLKEGDTRFHDRLDAKLYWDLYHYIFWPFFSNNRIKLKDRLVSRMEETLQ